MKKIRLFILYGLFCLPSVVNAQKIYIAEQYEFMGVPDQFGFSTLLRLYLEKYNYEALVVPQTDQHTIMRNLSTTDYAIQVQRKSTMFMTRVSIELVNTTGVVILKSPEGSSREKEFRYANIAALRMAMDNFSELKNHTFPSQSIANVLASKEVKQEVKLPDVVVQKTADINEVTVYLQARSISDNTLGLYKETSANPELMLYRTSSRDCFLVEINGALNGVLLFQNQKWFWEYYENNSLITKELLIKGL